MLHVLPCAASVSSQVICIFFPELSYMMHLLVSRICLSAAYSLQCHTSLFGYLVSDIGEHSRASTETKCTVESCPRPVATHQWLTCLRWMLSILSFLRAQVRS